MPHTSVYPMKVVYHHTGLATDVLRTYGYQGRCACGWVGPMRRSHDQARADSRIHSRKGEHKERANES